MAWYVTRNHSRVLVILENEKEKLEHKLKSKYQQQVAIIRPKFAAFLHLFSRGQPQCGSQQHQWQWDYISG